MKSKITILVVLFVLCSCFAGLASAQQCAKIKDGTITDAAGSAVALGYDKWGYNYQAHMFNGLLENYTRPDPPVTESDTNLVMKWSDDWLSNLDCNADGKLDRGGAAGATANISKGWLTNHFEGDYIGSDSEPHHYTEFYKIVYVGPAPPEPADDQWGPNRIWGVYAVIEHVLNDPTGGFHGNDKSALANPAGLGFWTK